MKVWPWLYENASQSSRHIVCQSWGIEPTNAGSKHSPHTTWNWGDNKTRTAGFQNSSILTPSKQMVFPWTCCYFMLFWRVTRGWLGIAIAKKVWTWWGNDELLSVLHRQKSPEMSPAEVSMARAGYHLSSKWLGGCCFCLWVDTATPKGSQGVMGWLWKNHMVWGILPSWHCTKVFDPLQVDEIRERERYIYIERER